MAHPKHRTSPSRKRSRRSHHHLVIPLLNECPNCNEKKPSHGLCPNCGYYKGRKVTEGLRERRERKEKESS